VLTSDGTIRWTGDAVAKLVADDADRRAGDADALQHHSTATACGFAQAVRSREPSAASVPIDCASCRSADRHRRRSVRWRACTSFGPPHRRSSGWGRPTSARTDRRAAPNFSARGVDLAGQRLLRRRLQGLRIASGFRRIGRKVNPSRRRITWLQRSLRRSCQSQYFKTEFPQAAHQYTGTPVNETLREPLMQRIGQFIFEFAGDPLPVIGVGQPVRPLATKARCGSARSGPTAWSISPSCGRPARPGRRTRRRNPASFH